MLHIAICDDNKIFLQELYNMVDSIIGEEHCIESFNNPNSLIKYINDNINTVEIVITDIKMPEFNGIQLAKSIKPIHPYVNFIFVTAYVDYIQDVFSVNPVYYIIKPVQKEKLKEAIELAQDRIKYKKGNTLKFLKKNNTSQIPIDEILFIESNKRKITIHTTNSIEQINSKLDEIQKSLPSHFIRCHQSFLVNMNMINHILNNKITLFSGQTIPVAKVRYSKIKKEVLKYWGDTL